MKKRNLMLGSAIILAVLLVAGGTLAWFTAEADPVTNEFTAGTLEMELMDYFCERINVNPGDSYPKAVYVKNTGSKRMFTRIKLIPEFVDVPNADISLVNYEILNGWVLHTDGYYYYPFKLAPGTPTPPIIEKVSFDGPGMGNEYQGKMFTLTAESDSIQVTNDAAETVWGVDPLTLAP